MTYLSVSVLKIHVTDNAEFEINFGSHMHMLHDVTPDAGLVTSSSMNDMVLATMTDQRNFSIYRECPIGLHSGNGIREAAMRNRRIVDILIVLNAWR